MRNQQSIKERRKELKEQITKLDESKKQAGEDFIKTLQNLNMDDAVIEAAKKMVEQVGNKSIKDIIDSLTEKKKYDS